MVFNNLKDVSIGKKNPKLPFAFYKYDMFVCIFFVSPLMRLLRDFCHAQDMYYFFFLAVTLPTSYFNLCVNFDFASLILC